MAAGAFTIKSSMQRPKSFMNAKEDRGQEEKFVPKPYYGGRSSTTKKAEKKKAEKPAAKAEEKPADTPTEAAPLDEQISFDSLGVSA